MTLQALANLGEFIAAMGVLISLVYLAVQVRQNTAAVRASTYHSVAEGSRQILKVLWGGADTRDFAMKVLESEELTPAEQFRLRNLMLSVWRHFDDLLYQHRVGTLEDELWLGYQQVYREYLEIPAVESWLREHQAYFSYALRSWLAENLPDARASPEWPSLSEANSS